VPDLSLLRFGTVFDPQQRAIPGADVRLTSVSTRAERRVTTNDQGIFQITGLLPGEYSFDLVLAVPGAHESHGAQAGNMNPLYWRPGRRSAVSVGGNRPNANYFLLDGTTNTDPT
jgi:hypothetical protein